eukprot:CAMPEP_0173158060 /NCGR_PEP_ID=MMETSP1105-20130129/16060_1 /TAXON_ID=2985 /ORGANISM="Ochromonas sp., Strain BG-1" /LENGTH=164 /DNA_ID=CAMNT_0014075773 /DNA_START=127 /DNA_END=621 /DNA_ORIENTATION=-
MTSFSSSSSLLLVLVLILCFMSQCQSFQASSSSSSNSPSLRRSPLRMIFSSLNSRSAAKPAVTIPYKITVDKKEITVDNASHNSNLRKLLISNKIDVYPLRAKLTGNCGGAGICGTCAVKVVSGKEFLNSPSKNELNTLKGKPEDWRLSCCSKVAGPIEIKTKP